MATVSKSIKSRPSFALGLTLGVCVGFAAGMLLTVVLVYLK